MKIGVVVIHNNDPKRLAYLRPKILELKKVIQKEYHCETIEIFEQKHSLKEAI